MGKWWTNLGTNEDNFDGTVAIYGKEHNLLDLVGWKHLKRISNRQGRMIRMVRQAKLKSFRMAKVFKYGFEVPRNHDDAVWLDIEAGNTKWIEGERQEMDQLKEYSTFEDRGLGAQKPEGYKMIGCHMVYDVKVDGWHKARQVAGGGILQISLWRAYIVELFL